MFLRQIEFRGKSSVVAPISGVVPRIFISRAIIVNSDSRFI